MKTTPDRDRNAYELARGYLLTIPGVTEIIVEKYQNLPSSRPKPASKNEIYRRLLDSAQNANMKAKVVGDAIGGVERLALISNNFDPEYVLKTYGDWEAVLDQIKEKLSPRGKIRRTPRSIWPRYCQTILCCGIYRSVRLGRRIFRMGRLLGQG